MYCIKNQSIGVATVLSLTYFRFFECLTTGLFAEPLSADFPDVEKIDHPSVAMGILNFESKIFRKV